MPNHLQTTIPKQNKNFELANSAKHINFQQESEVVFEGILQLKNMYYLPIDESIKNTTPY